MTDWDNWQMNKLQDEVVDEGTVADIEDAASNLDPLQDSQNHDMSAESHLYNDDTQSPLSSSSLSDGSDDEMTPDHSTALSEAGHFANGSSGMATCEYCGRVGVRDAFYSKTKRFCSMACSRNYAQALKDGRPIPYQPNVFASKTAGQTAGQGGRHKRKRRHMLKTYNWTPILNDSDVSIAPASCFRHCPLWSSVSDSLVGVKVEVINKDLPAHSHTAYWVAEVRRVAGYMLLLRPEGAEAESKFDFWKNIGSGDIHPVTWCARNGKSLVPPQSLANTQTDWRSYLIGRLTNMRTLPLDFETCVQRARSRARLSKGMKVEVIDKMCVSAVRVATVQQLIGGRLHLVYNDVPYDNKDFWCHELSQLIHPIGWALSTGHKLLASSEYIESVQTKLITRKFAENEATAAHFPKPREPPMTADKFTVGMKLEAIDPLNLSSISPATVTKVLKDNYIMVGIDGSMAQNGSDWFCYHATSASIFPVGFCEKNNIELTPPKGYKGHFKWLDYLNQCHAFAAPVSLFGHVKDQHHFKAGMKLEAVDLMEPRLLCVASIVRVAGRLLRIHFEGWDSGYDQWVDAASPDIYPVGWGELVGYQLEGPPPPADATSAAPNKHHRGKGRGVRRKRGSSLSSASKRRRTDDADTKLNDSVELSGDNGEEKSQ